MPIIGTAYHIYSTCTFVPITGAAYHIHSTFTFVGLGGGRPLPGPVVVEWLTLVTVRSHRAMLAHTSKGPNTFHVACLNTV